MGLRDLSASLAMDREPGTARWIEAPVGDPAAHEAFARARLKGPYPRGMGAWVVARKEHPRDFLGWVSLLPRQAAGDEAAGDEAALRWRIAEGARGRGYAPEAGARLVTYGFADLGQRLIAAEIDRENAAGRRVAEKIGMRLARDAEGVEAGRMLYVTEIHCRR